MLSIPYILKRKLADSFKQLLRQSDSSHTYEAIKVVINLIYSEGVTIRIQSPRKKTCTGL